MEDRETYELLRAYAEMGPVEEVYQLVRALPGWPGVVAQDTLCRDVIRSVYYTKVHPPSPRWLKSLLKRLEQDVLQSSGEDGFSDALAEVFMQQQHLAADVADRTEFHDESFITFLPPRDEALADALRGKSGRASSATTLRVLRLHNDVGTRIWEAGLFLAEILHRAPELLAGKAVVELGAGSGVTTLLAVKHCCTALRARHLPRSAVVTDHMPAVLENLEYNVELNAALERPRQPQDVAKRAFVYRDTGPDGSSDAAPECVVSVQPLDFATATVAQCARFDADVVLVADCTYSEEIIVHLVPVRAATARSWSEALLPPHFFSHVPLVNSGNGKVPLPRRSGIACLSSSAE